MYFPNEDLIPFIKAVDNKVKEVANKKGVQEHGGKIVQVTSELEQTHCLSLSLNNFC